MGTNERECKNNGQWSHSLPHCEGREQFVIKQFRTYASVAYPEVGRTTLEESKAVIIKVVENKRFFFHCYH